MWKEYVLGAIFGVAVLAMIVALTLVLDGCQRPGQPDPAVQQCEANGGTAYVGQAGITCSFAAPSSPSH